MVWLWNISEPELCDERFANKNIYLSKGVKETDAEEKNLIFKLSLLHDFAKTFYTWTLT